jgi:hypothetical protein
VTAAETASFSSLLLIIKPIRIEGSAICPENHKKPQSYLKTEREKKRSPPPLLYIKTHKKKTTDNDKQ